jgi:membrane protein
MATVTSEREEQVTHPAPPAMLPATRRWWHFVRGVKAGIRDDNLPLVAAGVAFFALLAIVPTLVAVVSVFGLIADPASVTGQVRGWLEAAPTEVRDLVATQLDQVAESSTGGLGLGLVVGVVAAMWSASKAMTMVIAAHNVIYDEHESRGFLKLRSLSLGLTLGAVLFMVFAAAALAVLPLIVERITSNELVRQVASVARWPILAGAMGIGLMVLYRMAPDRQVGIRRWLAPGAVVATLLWLGASALFTIYAANYASFNETYGSLGAIAVVMLWLYLTAFSVLFGAEVNSELERRRRG